MKILLRSLCMLLVLLWTVPVSAGHMPPPPPSGPGDITVPQPGDQSGGEEGGILPVYPVTGAMHQMPLESIVDTGRHKYAIGESTYSHEWKKADPNEFLLPHIATDRSREIIELSERVFKNFKQSEAKALAEAGTIILPLLVEKLNLPQFPAGWGAMEPSQRQTIESSLKSQRKVRQQAMELMIGISGEVKAPYRYLGLVDPDSNVVTKARQSFENAAKDDEVELEPLLLLAAGHKGKALSDLLKGALGDRASLVMSRIKALDKATKKKDLWRLLRDPKIPEEALAVGLERLDIPSLRGDEKKGRRKMLEKELKEIRTLVDIQVKRLGDPKSKKKPSLAHILIWGVQAKLGDKGVDDKLLALSRDSRWWARLLMARSGADLWESRIKATPKLLERSSDWIYEIRRHAVESLQFIHRIPMGMRNPPTLSGDSFAIDLWNKWWVARQEIAGLDSEEGWITVELKPGKGKVYGPNGLTEHPFLQGKHKKTKIFVIDHNENGSYDYGIDNFATVDVKKPGTFLSQLTRIDGKYYFLRMIPDKLALQLKPYEGPLGKVVIDENYTKNAELGFLVLSKSPDVTLQVDRDRKTKKIELEVPAGHYTVYAGRVIGKKSGSTDIAHLAPGLNRTVNVPAKGDVTVKLGQQLFVDVKMEFPGGPDRKDMFLKLSQPMVYGANGELYFNIEPQMSDLKVVIKSLDGKTLKTIEWKKEGHVDATDEEMGEKAIAEAQRLSQINELNGLVAQAQSQINIIEAQIANGPPYPGGATLEEMQALLAQWQTSLATWQVQLAQLQQGSFFSDTTVMTFNPVSIAMGKLPEEFIVEITGSTFFGKLYPAKLQIKGTERNK